MTVQLGPDSIKEIAELLHKFGFIDDLCKLLQGPGLPCACCVRFCLTKLKIVARNLDFSHK
jgi:hypothetical protein